MREQTAQDDELVMYTDEAWAIAEGIVSRRLQRGWSRQAILASIEGGPTPCGSFYLMRSGVIAIARFAMTQISDMNGRGCWFSIRDLLPPLPVHTHASTEELQPFQVGDKVWAWQKDEPNADCGQPDRPGADADWRRCDVPPRLSSTTVWSPILNDKEIGREEALYRRTDHWLPA